MKTQTNNVFKKTVLSFFVVSALAGAFIPWEDYIPRSQTPEESAFYENRAEINDLLFIEDFKDLNNESLASLSEHNLVAQLDAEVDAQVEINVQAFTEQDYSPEADERYDAELEREQLASIDAEATESENRQSLAMQPQETPEGKATLENPILFAYDSSEINPIYYKELNKMAIKMVEEVEKNNTVWQVVGFADLSGNYIYNSKLAKKRAQNVAAYLVDKGVGEAQLSIASLGSSQPVNTERTVENNRNERRVEIHTYQTELALLIKAYNKKIQKRVDEVEATKVAQQLAQQEKLRQQALVVQAEVESAIKVILVEENNAEQEATDVQQTQVLEKELTERLTTAMEL